MIICREIDTNLDGVKDIVRTYNEKGESLHEEADTNYDGRIDTWITFSGGRIAKEEIDTDFNGTADVWKYYVGGQLSRIQRDMNHDSRPDRWEFYNDSKLERVGVDLDFDGHVDLVGTTTNREAGGRGAGAWLQPGREVHLLLWCRRWWCCDADARDRRLEQAWSRRRSQRLETKEEIAEGAAVGRRARSSGYGFGIDRQRELLPWYHPELENQL